MPYFVSSIIAIVSAMIILTTRYESDNSNITAELDRMKSMFLTVDGFVNTYIESGESLRNVNFEALYNSGILLGNMTRTPAYLPTENVQDAGISSKLTFPSSTVIWHLIPNKDDSSSYKLLVDMRKNTGLMSKPVFSESFSSREFCEKLLFGTTQREPNKFQTNDFIINNGTDRDGVFVCIVYK